MENLFKKYVDNRISYTPLKRISQNLKIIFAIDVETFVDKYGNQSIMVITACHIDPMKNVHKIITVINPELYNKDPSEGEKDLWLRFYQGLSIICRKLEYKKIVIFAHNFGKFDGLYILKGLTWLTDIKNVESLIDDQKKMISLNAWVPFLLDEKGKPMLNKLLQEELELITLELQDNVKYSDKKEARAKLLKSKKILKSKEGLEIKFLDSMRLFPVSLDRLCLNFDVKGKKSVYNLEFNQLQILNSKMKDIFLDYSLQDSICLMECMLKAQNIYFKNYKVDITDSVSTSSLSLKIYRTNFWPKDFDSIPY